MDNIKLIVREPFASYSRGDEIVDADEVARVLQSHAGHVNKVAMVEEAPAAPKKAK